MPITSAFAQIRWAAVNRVQRRRRQHDRHAQDRAEQVLGIDSGMVRCATRGDADEHGVELSNGSGNNFDCSLSFVEQAAYDVRLLGDFCFSGAWRTSVVCQLVV